MVQKHPSPYSFILFVLCVSADDFRTSCVLIILKRTPEANLPFPGSTVLPETNKIKSSFSCRTLIHAGWLLELNSGEIAGNFTKSVTLVVFYSLYRFCLTSICNIFAYLSN